MSTISRSSSSRRLAGTLAACVATLLLAAPAICRATPSRAQRIAARALLTDIVQGPASTSGDDRFGATDDRDTPLASLKVVQVGGQYIGVYHAQTNGRFDVSVATSDDLLHWHYRATLDTDASNPTIRVLPGNAFVVAYEKTTIGDLLDRPLLTQPLAPLYGPLNRIRLRFRYYRSVDQLLAAQDAREMTAPRKLSTMAEGTPNITGARLRGGKTTRSQISVRFHYLAALRKRPDADRQGVGVLKDFRKWSDRADPRADRRILHAKLLHDGFTSPPAANVGARDDVILHGVRLELQEAQYVQDDYASWRIFVVDPHSATALPAQISTPGGSHSFGNPTVTALTAPDGRPAILVTLFVFSEGSGPGEAGPLIFYREL